MCRRQRVKHQKILVDFAAKIQSTNWPFFWFVFGHKNIIQYSAVFIRSTLVLQDDACGTRSWESLKKITRKPHTSFKMLLEGFIFQ